MSARPCSDLGVCQSRSPACPGCQPRPFAPGVIERHRRQLGTPAQRRELKRWLLALLVLCVLLGTLGLAAGLHLGA